MNGSDIPPDQSVSARTWRSVRRNRRRFTQHSALALAGFAAVTVIADLQAGNELWLNTHPATVILLISWIPFGLVLLSRPNAAPYFRYDPRSGRIEARSAWGFWRVYPEPGYDLLEFSLAFGEVHEVAADGRRRKLAIGPTWANRAEWQEFLESFHPAAHFPIPIRPHEDQS